MLSNIFRLRRALLLSAIALVFAFNGCGSDSPTGMNPVVEADPITDYKPTAHLMSPLVYAITGTSSDNVFAACDEAMILHYDGASWRAVERPQSDETSPDLADIHAVSPDVMFAVGDNVTYRYDGTQWHVDDPGTALLDAEAVWADAADNAYAVGFQGRAFHFDGTAWTEMATPTTEWLNGVWGIGSTVFAVGRNGVMMRWNGASWEIIDTGTTEFLEAVWGTSASNVYAVGRNGVAIRWTGNGVDSLATGTTQSLRAVWGTNANTVYAGGQDIVLRYDGASWTEIQNNFEPNTPIFDLWGSAGNDIFAAVWFQGVLRYDGTTWSDQLNQEFSSWNHVFGFSSTDMYATYANTVAHFDGSQWTKTDVSPYTDRIFDIWGLAANDMWIFGPSEPVHFDGTSWVVANSASVGHLSAWGPSTDDVFAVGADGLISRWDGTQWKDMQSNTTVRLNAVAGSGSNDVYAVGNGGAILHFNGTTWTDLVSPTSVQLVDIEVFASNNVYALMNGGDFAHFDGTTWSIIDIPVNTARKMSATSPDNIFLAGINGTIQWFDGTGWRELATVSQKNHDDVIATSPGNVWVAAGSHVVQYTPR